LGAGGGCEGVRFSASGVARFVGAAANSATIA
jgi:hypothetical protein